MRFALHPVLLAIYLPLQIFAAHPREVAIRDVGIAVLVVALPPLLLLAILRLACRDGSRLARRHASPLALVLSLAVVACFSYGLVRSATVGRDFLGIAWVSDAFLLAAYAIVFLLGGAGILLLRRPLVAAAARGLNLFSMALVSFALVSAGWNWISSTPRASRVARTAGSSAAAQPGAPAAAPDSTRPPSLDIVPSDRTRPPDHTADPDSTRPPDIYYIVLDGYGRDDTLRDRYGFDNSEFLAWLESRGFYVARESSPNYISTVESIASSLNLRYLEATRGETDPGRTASIRSTLHQRIQESEAMRFLQERGYQVVAFDSGLASTSLRHADVFLAPSFGLSEYHLELVGSTIFAPLTKKAHGLHAARIRFILDRLARLGAEPGPKFVFAHLLVPHPPYVFDREGRRVRETTRLSFREERLPDDVYVGRYTEQVRFINAEMQRVIDALVSASATPPVIVLQADHGPGFNSEGQAYIEERARIFNAYHLPGTGAGEAYPTLSPVNTFRVIFRSYFGAGFENLPDGYLIAGRPATFPR